MGIEGADSDGKSCGKPEFFRPLFGQNPCAGVRRERFLVESVAEFPEPGVELGQEISSREPSPLFVVHGFVSGRAPAAFDRFGSGCSCEDRRNVIAALHPAVGRREYFGIGPEAVEYFAEKPFRRIGAPALCQIFRMLFGGECCDSGRFPGAGVVLPQPGEGVGIIPEAIVETEGYSPAVYGKRRGAGCVDADADDLVGIEITIRFFGFIHCGAYRNLHPFQVVLGVLAGEVRISRVQNNAVFSCLVFVNRSCHLFSVGHIND